MKILPSSRSLFASLLAASFGISAFCAAPSVPQLLSPDGRIAVDIRTAQQIAFDMSVDERPVLKNATLALQLEQMTFGRDSTLKAVTPRSHDGLLRPPVRIKAETLREHYNELRLELEGGAAVTFRAYN
jgi:alpha-glucosidase